MVVERLNRRGSLINPYWGPARRRKLPKEVSQWTIFLLWNERNNYRVCRFPWRESDRLERRIIVAARDGCSVGRGESYQHRLFTRRVERYCECRLVLKDQGVGDRKLAKIRVDAD